MSINLFPLLLAVLAAWTAVTTAHAQIEWRVSVKIILGPQGQRPPFGVMNEDADVTNEINWANEIYRATGRGYQYRLTEIVELAGVSQWYDADSESGSVLHRLDDAARNNIATYAFRNDAINVYVNNSAEGGICSYPSSSSIIILIGRVAGKTRVLAHEAGHFFDLCHTFGCSCNPCDNPESDGILDTLRHTSSESEDDIAQRAYGTTYDNLTAAKQESVADTYLNVMSYYSDPIRITSDQLDKQTDTSNGARLNVASGRTRFVDYRNNGQFPNGGSAKTSPLPLPNGTGGPYPTIAQGAFFAGENVIVLIRSGTYQEGLMLDRPMTLRATRGNAILR